MFPMGLQGHVRNPRRPLVSTPVQSWGNFSPLALRPIAWYDASDLSTITSSAGKVSQWRDKSGWARNLSQATGANQPTTGSVTQNGLNTIGFDGSTQFIETSSALTLSNPATANYWFLAVMITGANKGTPFVSTTSAGVGEAFPLSFSGSSYQWQAFRTNTGLNTTTATAANTTYLVTCNFDGAATFLRVNGVQIVSGTAGTEAVTGFRIGRNKATSYSAGQLCEFVGINGPLHPSVVAAWETYANAKWAVY